MKITALTAQAKSDNRVNVMVDGVYRFSLDIFQVADLGIRVGKDYTEEELQELESESQFGKLYGRALEYTMLRPHSEREISDYLYRKTRDTRTKTGAIKKGYSPEVAERVLCRLREKGHINDAAFAQYWVQNRSLRKGASQRKLTVELRSKGVEPAVIDTALRQSDRQEEDELKKVIAKKQARYPDEQKFIRYLVGQGFSYDDVKRELNSADYL